jgi:hypothetical protein
MTCPDCERHKAEAARISEMAKRLQARAKELRDELGRIKASPVWPAIKGLFQ